MPETDDPEVKWADGIDPALTAEEWARRGCIRKPNVMQARDGPNVGNGHGCLDIAEAGEDDDSDGDAMVAPHARHALAALALNGQPYGFTREDVLILQEISVDFDLDGFHETADALRSIANRIAALLPA